MTVFLMRSNRTLRRGAPLFMLLAVACSGDSTSSPDAGVTSRDAGEKFCPTRLNFTVLDEGVVHVGWTGATHNNRFPPGAEFVVEVTACDDECRNCRFEGPIPDPTINLQRCMTDTSVACDATTTCPPFQCITTQVGKLCANDFSPCSVDSDCSPGECWTFLGANSGSPIRNNCFAPMFRTAPGQSPVVGTIDLETGRTTFDNFGIWIVSSDEPGTPGFCPVCTGDTERNDGNKDGTCTENPHGRTAMGSVGRPCDAHSSSGIPSRAGVYSLDCAVPFAPSFDMTIRKAGSAVETTWTLDAAEQPMCDGAPCWCGVCEGTAVPCHAHSDCGSGITCVGVVDAPAVPPKNNFCITPCTWDPTRLRGGCMGVVGVDGEGMAIIAPTNCLPGSTDANARISVVGSSRRLSERSYSVGTAGLGCASQSFVGAVNTAIGLPGPNVSTYRFQVDAE